jgi:hypothetical protein
VLGLRVLRAKGKGRVTAVLGLVFTALGLLVFLTRSGHSGKHRMHRPDSGHDPMAEVKQPQAGE